MQEAEPMRAIPHLSRAIELEPKNGNYHYQLGRAYAQTGRQKEA
jgi:Flp pilus assembly protein TadD